MKVYFDWPFTTRTKQPKRKRRLAMRAAKCALCREHPRSRHFGDDRFCRRCTMKMRWFLFKNRHLPLEDLELIFAMLVDIFQRYMTLCSDALARVERKKDDETEWPDFDENGVAIDSHEEEEPADEEMLEGDVFATEEEAFANAQARFARELPTMLAAERQRLAEGGRRRTSLTFTPFKEKAACTSLDTPRRGKVPGAPVNKNGRKMPPAGEESMSKPTQRRCDVCEFFQFTPERGSETTCPYCQIVRKFATPEAVKTWTLSIQHCLRLCEVPANQWENDTRRLCGEAQRRRVDVMTIVAERLEKLPHCVCCKEPMPRSAEDPACTKHEPWRLVFMTRVAQERMPDEFDCATLIPDAWHAWADLGVDNGNVDDDDAWKIVLPGIVQLAWDRAVPAEVEETPAPPTPPPLPQEPEPVPQEPAPTPLPPPPPAPVREREVVEVPTPPEPPAPPVTPPAPEIPPPAPLPIPALPPVEQSTNARSLPQPLKKILAHESVWLSNNVSQKYPELTREQRYQLIAIRRMRLCEIAKADHSMSAQEIGYIFNAEVPRWITRIKNEQSVSSPPQRETEQSPVAVVNALCDDLIKKIKGDASERVLVLRTNLLRAYVLSQLKS